MDGYTNGGEENSLNSKSDFSTYGTGYGKRKVGEQKKNETKGIKEFTYGDSKKIRVDTGMETRIKNNAIEVIFRVTLSLPAVECGWRRDRRKNKKKINAYEQVSKRKTLSYLIERRVYPGAVVVKKIDESEQPYIRSFYIVVFKNSKEFFKLMDDIFPGTFSRWKNGEKIITINVDGTQHDLSALKTHLMEPLKIESKEHLFTETFKLLERYDSVANSPTTANRIQKLQNSVLDLQKYIFRIYPQAEVSIHGSWQTGLAEEQSEVDLVLYMNHFRYCGYVKDTREMQIQWIDAFKYEMERPRGRFRNPIAALDGSTPILKFEHKETGFKCNLSFLSAINQRGGELVKLYLDSDPRVKFVIAGVKFWMKQNNLADENVFTSWAQIWLVLFYLMQKNYRVICPIKKLRQMVLTQDLAIEGWDCSVPKFIKWKSKCCLSREELLEGFFIFYSEIPLDNIVLRTSTGKAENTKSFLRSDRWTNLYYMMAVATNNKKATRSTSVAYGMYLFQGFSIQDPFNQFENLTTSMRKRKSGYKCAKFVEWCRQTAELLTEI